MTDPPTTRSYRVVLAATASSRRADDVLRAPPGPSRLVDGVLSHAELQHLHPRVTPSGLGASVTITTIARSQAEAEGYAADAVGKALGESVRVIMSVSL